MSHSHFSNIPNSNDGSLMLLAQLSANVDSNTMGTNPHGTQATNILNSDTEFPDFDDGIDANAIANVNEGRNCKLYAFHSFNFMNC